MLETMKRSSHVGDRGRRDWLRRLRRGSAFTLIELLAVIAILSLLIAIVLPSLGNARRASRRAACQSNLHQIVVAWQAWLDGHDGLYPALAEVVADAPEVLRCPADDGGDAIRPSVFAVFGSSYLSNSLLTRRGPPLVAARDPCADVIGRVTRRPPTRGLSAQMPDPARLVLLGDYGWVSAVASSDRRRIEWHGRPCSHNLAFVDGHVDFVRIHKGLLVTQAYVVIPFKDLVAAAVACQVEAPCP